MKTIRNARGIMLLLPALAFSCGGGGGNEADSGVADAAAADAGASDSGVVADAGPDAGRPDAGSLPTSLEIEYGRTDSGEPVSDADVSAFTLKVLGFLKKVRYFDYVLYTTHGVDASTGLRDFQFWYDEQFRKEGDKVTFHHPVNPDDGGHNLHIPFSRALGDVIAAYMLTGDQIAALASEKLCKGMSASMLGMVYDGSDTLPHLMSRNIVAFNHEFLTHDGKKKGVDYGGWFSSYPRWNTNRFPYEHNPYWGKVWVTNIRSKDDVPHIFRLIPILRYAAEGAAAQNVKDACGEALTLLTAFAKDIVDSDYRIRSKDENGVVFMPGFTEDPELNKQQGDLASFINYRETIPDGECNARRAAELIGYHEPKNENCGRGEPNAYDDIAFTINSYNKRICRYFHLAHVANALVNRDNRAAQRLMDGLDERMSQEKALKESQMQTEPDEYRRTLALYLAQSDAFGFPLGSDEVRMIQLYYGRAVDELSAWPYWDPWAETVPEGDLGGYRPPSCKTGAEGVECWFQVEDLAQVFETCWSPFVNPSGKKWVDCEIVRDPSQWPAE